MFPDPTLDRSLVHRSELLIFHPEHHAVASAAKASKRSAVLTPFFLDDNVEVGSDL
jgi:hypothetical protein